MLTAKTIAALLDRNEDTVHLWRAKGVRVKRKSRTVVVRLSSYRIGCRYYFTSKSVASFLDAVGWPFDQWPDPLRRALASPDQDHSSSGTC